MADPDDLLQSALARALGMMAAKDPSAALDPAVAAEISALTQVSEEARDPQVWFALAWLHWTRFRAAPEGGGATDLEAALRNFLPLLLGDPGRWGMFPAGLMPRLMDRAWRVATAQLNALEESYDTRRADAVVHAWQRIAQSTPAEDRKGKRNALINLGSALFTRYTGGGQLTDLDSAIAATEAAMAIDIADDPQADGLQLNLGTMLQHRYLRGGVSADLDAAVAYIKNAAAIAGSGPVQSMALVNLGNVLRHRYERDGGAVDLEEAIAAISRALSLEPDDAAARSNLGMLLTDRFERSGSLADADAAVAAIRAALDRTPADHPNRYERLSVLGRTLAARAARSGATEDITEAVAATQAAVALAPANIRGRYLGNLGATLMARFRHGHQAADLDEAITATEAALRALPPTDPHYRIFTSNLGVMLQCRSQATGVGHDLDGAIALHQRAARAGDPGQVEASTRSLEELAYTLSLRAQRTSAPADQDAAISAAITAARATPPGHPSHGRRLSNASIWLWERFKSRGVPDDLEEAAELGRAAVQAGLDGNMDRPLTLANLAAVLSERFKRSADQADAGDIDDAVTVATIAVETLPPGADRAVALVNLTDTLCTRYRSRRDPADLAAVVAVSDAVLPGIPPDAPYRLPCLANLAIALRLRYEHTRSTVDLTDAITRVEATAALDPADKEWHLTDLDAEAERIRSLLDPATAAPALAIRYALAWLYTYQGVELGSDDGVPMMFAATGLFRTCLLLGDEEIPGFGTSKYVTDPALMIAGHLHVRAQESKDPVLTAAVPEIFQRILALLPADHWLRPACVMALGTAQWDRFQLGGASAKLLDAAVNNLREAAAGPADLRWAALNMLVHALLTRYKRTGDVQDLTLAIDTAHTAASAANDDDQRAEALVTLGQALFSRFTALGVPADLDDSVSAADAAVELTAPGHPRYASRLTELCAPLRLRFERLGDRPSLQRCVEVATAAAEAAGDDKTRAGALYELAMATSDRYSQQADIEDLQRVVSLAREAIHLTSADPDVMLRMVLGLALRQRAMRTGSQADIDESVDLARAVLAATPADHSERPIRLSHLAEALRWRFAHAGDRADLDEAVETARAAAASPWIERGARPMVMSCLGRALRSRFDDGGDQADLDGAVSAFTAAASGREPGYFNQASWLQALAATLRVRARLRGDLDDLSAAIGHIEDALAIAPENPVIRAEFHATLGGVLYTRYELAGAAADLYSAIDNLRIADRDTPPDDPGRAEGLFSLARMLELRANPADLTTAAEGYGSVADAGQAAPSLRIDAAVRLAGLVQRSAPGQAAASLEKAVRLLPEVAPRGLNRGDQQHALERMSGVAGQAAELILADRGDPRRAVRALQVLETGRTILLNQALELSGDLSELRERHPELAARFERVREQLDTSGDVRLEASAPRRVLADDLSRTLAEIRGKDGFAAFGRPPSAEELTEEAARGPVVVFNVGRGTGHAILITAVGISVLELPRLTRDAVIQQVNKFTEDLRGGRDAGVSRTLEWLWDNVTEPVLHALGYDAPPTDDQWPRVWWVLGGLLSMLPLHAAGYHVADGRDSVLDRVVSSYTPTVRALRYARQHPAAPRVPLTALVVAMPTTPGVPGRLSFVPTEVEMLRSRLFQPIVLTEPGPGETAQTPLPTKANVLARLPGCPIVHFACHGTSNPQDPSRSRLLLHDHQEDPLTVSSFTSLHLHGPQLAYLSACRTAATDAAALADEAIHLVSAFQLAGYPHVIGTLWEINDKLAVELAERFYQGLRSTDRLIDVGRSADALRRAVRAVRAKHLDSPTLWAAYLHAGALPDAAMNRARPRR